MADTNPLAMSDEDFLKQGIPSPSSAAPQEETSAEPAPSEEPAEEPQKAEEEPKPSTEEDHPDEATPPAAEPPGSEPKSEPEPKGEEGKQDNVPKSKGNEEPGKDEPKKTEENTAKSEAPDYEGFYKQIMQPIKANGKTIELKTPEEAIRLIQMGAGYTKKLQELQPAIKTFRMLEKADLLDEGKLSYLIDIHNKNPEAIKKLIKESGIDPLDLNPGDNVSYVPGNHSVSDQELAFNDVLQDVQSSGGQKVIDAINQTWDQKSIQLVWENPEVLKVIQSQHESGHYPIISAEIDRQKSLGHIPSNTPFLVAYKQIGDSLASAGAFDQLNGSAQQRSPQTASPPGQETQKPQPQVIATRPGTPKDTVKNGDRAKAAAPTSHSPGKAKTVVNPFAMSDDEFMKQFQSRS